MASEATVTRWIAALKAGDEDAATRIWERFFPKLMHLARDRLSPATRRVYNEEDAALSAFRSFVERKLERIRRQWEGKE